MRKAISSKEYLEEKFLVENLFERIAISIDCTANYLLLTKFSRTTKLMCDRVIDLYGPFVIEVQVVNELPNE